MLRYFPFGFNLFRFLPFMFVEQNSCVPELLEKDEHWHSEKMSELLLDPTFVGSAVWLDSDCVLSSRLTLRQEAIGVLADAMATRRVLIGH